MKVFTIAPEVNTVAGLSVDEPFFRIMLSLPPHCRQFACTDTFADSNKALMDFLKQNQVRIRINTFEQLGPNSVVYADVLQKSSPNQIFLKMKENGVQFLYYWDMTEEQGLSPQPGEFFLYTSETQMFCCLDKGGYNIVGGAVEAGIGPNGGQGAAVGLVRSNPHSRESAAAGHSGSDRAAMRLRLEEELGVQFNPELPLVVHFMDHHLDVDAVVEGLNAVSRRANVLVKDLDWHGGLDMGDFRDHLNGPNMYLCPKHSPELKNLIRFSADLLLPGCFSGFVSTSLMMGLRIAPVYTQKVYRNYADFVKKQPTSFTAQMREAFRTIPLRIMDNISPLCIGAADMIMERLNDEDYWRRYDESLPRIQRAVFGRYLLDEAAIRRAGAFVLRLTQTGDFVPGGIQLQPLATHLLRVEPVAFL